MKNFFCSKVNIKINLHANNWFIQIIFLSKIYCFIRAHEFIIGIVCYHEKNYIRFARDNVFSRPRQEGCARECVSDCVKGYRMEEGRRVRKRARKVTRNKYQESDQSKAVYNRLKVLREIFSAPKRPRRGRESDNLLLRKKKKEIRKTFSWKHLNTNIHQTFLWLSFYLYAHQQQSVDSTNKSLPMSVHQTLPAPETTPMTSIFVGEIFLFFF